MKVTAESPSSPLFALLSSNLNNRGGFGDIPLPRPVPRNSRLGSAITADSLNAVAQNTPGNTTFARNNGCYSYPISSKAINGSATLVSNSIPECAVKRSTDTFQSPLSFFAGKSIKAGAITA